MPNEELETMRKQGWAFSDNEKYLVLYYFSFIVTILFIGFSTYKSMELLEIGDINFTSLLSNMTGNILLFINIVLVIIFTILINLQYFDIKKQ